MSKLRMGRPGLANGKTRSYNMCFVLHSIGPMALRVLKLTVTLQGAVARWARVEAARNDISVSQLLEHNERRP